MRGELLAVSCQLLRGKVPKPVSMRSAGALRAIFLALRDDRWKPVRRQGQEAVIGNSLTG